MRKDNQCNCNCNQPGPLEKIRTVVVIAVLMIQLAQLLHLTGVLHL